MSYLKPSFLRHINKPLPAVAAPMLALRANFPASKANMAVPSAAKPAEKPVKRDIKISDHFVQLEAATGKLSHLGSTRAFVEKRLALDEKRDALAAARLHTPEQKQHIREIKREKDQLKEETRQLYTRGPMGLSDEVLKKKRRQQYVPASFEGLHTALGARLFTAMSGIGALEIGSAGGKTALRQGLGNVTQSGASSILRIATEIAQIRANKAGKPRLPENLTPRGNFKQSSKAMEQARKTLLSAQENLQAALHAVKAENTPENIKKLQCRQDEVADAIAALVEFEGVYDNLCVMLEKEFRGKKASAAVSVLSGLMSGGAYALEPTGAAALAGHKLLCLGGLLLQLPMSAMDYMDGTVDYPQKVGADRIDLKLLLKEKARYKSLTELDDEDFDATIAARLYDEKPQLVQEVIRATYRHELGRLNADCLRLSAGIEQGKFSRLPLSWQPASAQKKRAGLKARALDKAQRKFAELQSQIVLYEQHKGCKLDPKGLIGRAISDPLYFCRKGISAQVFNKVGEFFTQANQRIANNYNPMSGLGLVAVGHDIVQNVAGASVFHDGMHSMAGSVADNPRAEAGMLGMATGQVLGSANAGVTTISARVGKAEDRKALGTPDFIARGQGVDQSLSPRAQIEQALEFGIISERKQKKLGKARDLLDKSAMQEDRGDNLTRYRKAERKWAKFQKHRNEVNALVATINRDWLIQPRDEKGNRLLDHAGEPVVIDLRQTAECLASCMPLLERAWLPLKTLPRSVLRSLTFWKDVIQAKRTADECKPLVNRGKVLDQDLDELIKEADRVLMFAETLDATRLTLAFQEDDDDFTVARLMAALDGGGSNGRNGCDGKGPRPDSDCARPVPAGTATATAVLPPKYEDPVHALVPPAYAIAASAGLPAQAGRNRQCAMQRRLLDLQMAGQ